MPRSAADRSRPRTLALGLGLGAGLLLAGGWWLGATTARRAAPTWEDLPALRDAAVRDLAGGVPGIYDSHPDPDVGHVLLPNLDREAPWGRLRTNRFGLREREYALRPGPETFRVVLLGDSYVYGWRVADEVRLGARLEEALRGRSGDGAPAVEVLHVAVPSWNIRAEVAFLRRQLDALRPDLVVHVTVQNDLDDGMGVRVAGLFAEHAPEAPGRAGARVYQNHPAHAGGDAASNLLHAGLDHEGRRRLEEAGARCAALEADLTARGADYLLLSNWGVLNPLVARHVAPHLEPDSVAFLPTTYRDEPALRIGPDDAHWSPTGHARVAQTLFGLLQPRLADGPLALAEWPGAREIAEEECGAAREVALSSYDEARAAVVGSLASEVGPAVGSTGWMMQVHGGLDVEGFAAPESRFLLRRPDAATALRLVGHGLDAPRVARARVEVEVDGEPVGAFEVRADVAFDERLELPAAARSRDVLTVTLVADDWAYTGDTLRRSVALRLERAALEP